MILYLYDLDNCRENFIDSNCIMVLEIEKPKYLAEVINALKTHKEVSPVAIYDRDKRLNLEREGCIIIDYFIENELSKSIFSKLMDKLFQEDILGYRVQFGDVSEQVSKIMFDIVKESDIRFKWNQDVEPKDYLKLMGFKIDYSEDILENCLNFISICGIMKLYKIVVFYNLKSLLSSESMVKLYRHCLYSAQIAIFLDSQHYEEKLDYENKVYVDEDLFDLKL